MSLSPSIDIHPAENDVCLQVDEVDLQHVDVNLQGDDIDLQHIDANLHQVDIDLQDVRGDLQALIGTDVL